VCHETADSGAKFRGPRATLLIGRRRGVDLDAEVMGQEVKLSASADLYVTFNPLPLHAPVNHQVPS